MRNWARGAGSSEPQIETLNFTVEFPPLRQHIVNHLRALPWSAPFFALSPTAQATAVEKMVATLASYTHTDGSASIPTAALLFTAER